MAPATAPAHWRAVTFAALLAVALAPAATAAAVREDRPPSTIDLAAGTSTSLTFATPIGTAFVADPTTADVNVLDRHTLFVLGQAPGITSLTIHDDGGRVLARHTVRVHRETRYADAVVAEVAGSRHAIRVTSVGDALFVSGTAEDPSQAERVLRGIQAVAGDAPVIDGLTLRTPAQVNLDVLISEVSRNVTRELGIDWSLDINPFEHPLRTWATGTGSRLGTGAMQLANIYEHVIEFVGAVTPDSPLTGDVTARNEVAEAGIQEPPRAADGGALLVHRKEVNSGKYRATAFLEALAENGLVVVHARPSLTTVSGQPAQFFSGLEIPVPTIGDTGIVGTEYRETGVSLTFTPTVLAGNQISLTVEPRMREIAAGGATIAGTIVPNINERSASTTVEVADGESIAIAGLYRRNTTSSDSGIPLLKDIPIWGSLFKTSRDTDRSVELIIVVTPRIVAGVAGATAGLTADPVDPVQQTADQFYY